MSDKPSNNEFNDELLSAYLDGELTADERAAVEARLATDPAAQQLLHELRSVSQSVQSMPTESVGRDLSDDIIQRIQVVSDPRVVRRSPDSVPAYDRTSPISSPAGGPLPKIRIFGSQRAWVWAAMTLAAGLLIMFVQSRDKSANDLPNLAERNHAPAESQFADNVKQPPRREISVSPPPGMAAAPSASLSLNDGKDHDKSTAPGGAISATAPSGQVGGGGTKSNSVTRDRAAAPPASIAADDHLSKPQATGGEKIVKANESAASSAIMSRQLAQEKGVAAPLANAPSTSSAGSFDAPVALQKLDSPMLSSTPRRIVVRVAARPEALKNGAFEQLLADNKIEFAPESAKKESLSFGGQLRKPVENERKAVQDQATLPAVVQAADVVLVEAPPATIESCLAELNKNSNDFPSISVSGETSTPGSDAKFTLADKSKAAVHDLGRFNRGNAFADKQPLDTRAYFYAHESAQSAASVANGSPRIAGKAQDEDRLAAGVDRVGGTTNPLFKQQSTSSGVRRASRIAVGSTGTPQPDNSAPSAPSSPPVSTRDDIARFPADTDASQLAATARPPGQPAVGVSGEAKSADVENWQVLFVFVPAESPAPVASPAKQPK